MKDEAEAVVTAKAATGAAVSSPSLYNCGRRSCLDMHRHFTKNHNFGSKPYLMIITRHLVSQFWKQTVFDDYYTTSGLYASHSPQSRSSNKLNLSTTPFLAIFLHLSTEYRDNNHVGRGWIGCITNRFLACRVHRCSTSLRRSSKRLIAIGDIAGV